MYRISPNSQGKYFAVEIRAVEDATDDIETLAFEDGGCLIIGDDLEAVTLFGIDPDDVEVVS